MKKVMLTAALAAFIFAGCGNRQVNDTDDGIGAGDGTDTLQEPMHPNDTAGMASPIDTALDTTSMP